MDELIERYFHKDLTEAEESALSEMLGSSEDASDRFLGMAEAAYHRYGLPDPSTDDPASPTSSWPKWTGWTALGLLLLVSALVVTKRPSVPITAPSAAPAITVAPERRAPAPKVAAPKTVAPRTVAPQATPRPKSYTLLKVVVSQAAPGPVTVRVLSPEGIEVRRLYEGTLKAGEWAFRWDGRVEDGSAAKPGLYTVETDNGTVVKKQEVVVR